MRPLLTLASCSHECLTPRRRSKYSGADIMPSTNNGLGALEDMWRARALSAGAEGAVLAQGDSTRMFWDSGWAFVRNGIDKTMDKLI